jgi:hypothetical protein
MMQKIVEQHRNDPDGNPAGGETRGIGIDIRWQDGPLGRHADGCVPGHPCVQGCTRREANGAFVEGVLSAALGRLEYYQSTKFKSRHNALAITKIEEALHWLNARTQDREIRHVEGTHTA